MRKVWILLFALTIVLIGILVVRSLRPQPASGLMNATSENLIPVLSSPSADTIIQEPVSRDLQDPGSFSGQENGANFTDVAKVAPDELDQLDL